MLKIVYRRIFLFSKCSLSFGERRLSYRLRSIHLLSHTHAHRFLHNEYRQVYRRRYECRRSPKYKVHYENKKLGYLSHCQNSVKKTAFPCKISLKSSNRLLGYGQKWFSIWRLSAILNFKKKIHLWSRDCHRVPNVLFCTKLHQNWMIFCWDMAI